MKASWREAWTGGQYSLVRLATGATLAVLFLRAAFASGEISLFSAGLALAAIAFGLGAGGRMTAIVLASLMPFGFPEDTDSAAVMTVNLWMLIHLFTLPAPFGSVAALGREDPRGGWSMPAWIPAFWQGVFVLACLVEAISAFMNGYQILAAVFIAASVLALFPSAALFAWSLSLGLEIGLAASGHSSWLYLWLLHLFTFQPAWIPRGETDGRATVFYDGDCALCHSSIRFLLSEDPSPSRFRIAPLASPAFLQRVPERIRMTRPDSVVVVRGEDVTTRGAAAVAVLGDLGGLWWIAHALLRALPRTLLDSMYDGVASRRYRWFGKKTDACPLMPAADRARFDDGAGN